MYVCMYGMYVCVNIIVSMYKYIRLQSHHFKFNTITIQGKLEESGWWLA